MSFHKKIEHTIRKKSTALAYRISKALSKSKADVFYTLEVETKNKRK